MSALHFGNPRLTLGEKGTPITFGKGAGGFPLRGSSSTAALDLDFIGRRYYANGAIQDASWMTTLAGTPTIEADGLKADAGDQLTTPDQSWFNNSEGTIVIEFVDTGHANDGDRVAFSLHQGSGASQQRLEVLTQYTAGLSDRVLKVQALNYGGASIGGGISGISNDYYRAVINWRFGEACTMQIGGATISLGTWAGSWAAAMARTGLGYWRTTGGSAYFNAAGTGRVRRIAVFKTRQSDAWGTALSLRTAKRNLHFLGDSFLASGAEMPKGALHRAFNDTFRAITFDGVASSTLTQQADRFDLAPQYWDRQVVIINGSADGNNAATLIAAYDSIAARSAYQPVYVQPNMGSGTDYYTGQPNRLTWDATEAAVLAHVGADHYVSLLAGMQAANDGSANDLADVANGIWPRSLTGDGLHPNAVGAVAEAGLVRDHITSRGW